VANIRMMRLTVRIPLCVDSPPVICRAERSTALGSNGILAGTEGIGMRVKGWSNGSARPSGAGYGLRVSLSDRDEFFDDRWDSVEVVLGEYGRATVPLSESFWGHVHRASQHSYWSLAHRSSTCAVAPRKSADGRTQACHRQRVPAPRAIEVAVTVICYRMG